MKSLNRFTCEEAFRRLDDYLDGELKPDAMALVSEHLEICEGCAREFNFERSILHGVRQKLRQIEIPDDVMSRIALTLAADREHPADDL
jgi:anti-sigma factor (TIGR02949 family)